MFALLLGEHQPELRWVFGVFLYIAMLVSFGVRLTLESEVVGMEAAAQARAGAGVAETEQGLDPRLATSAWRLAISEWM